ncbi:MAG: urea ABC transporter ATP-binding protein UrtD [Candidatus Thioglobus sp.]|nr:MAG: urea ABC transporter ATP-binding protein UrtD [Candidatus Thioglobus sp.]|tara:strand:+ start:641 stop:1396 length:756 start_codon:yes stop_codon:yes gene_type:complete
MTTDHETILYLNNVSVSFDGFKAIDDLSIVVERNELRCIIGPNGAGKTTMMDIITGKTKCDQGEVVFGKDIDLTQKDEAQIANLGIGRKFQKPTVFESMTVFENLNLALEGQRTVLQTLFYKLTNERQAKIEQTLEIIGLQDLADMRAGELSHGQKQWLEIGMLISQNPRVLLVDEPVAGMTHQESERTAELLIALADEYKHCVIVVEHDMEFVRSIARKVTVLHQGSVLAEGSMESIQNNPKVREVYLGD